MSTIIDEGITFRLPESVSYASSGCIEGSVALVWPSSRASFEATSVQIRLHRIDRINIPRLEATADREITVANTANPLTPGAIHHPQQSVDLAAILSKPCVEESTAVVMQDFLLRPSEPSRLFQPSEEAEFQFELYLPSQLCPSFSTPEFSIQYELVLALSDSSGQTLLSKPFPILIVEFPSVQPKNVPSTFTWSHPMSTKCRLKFAACCQPELIFTSVSVSSSYHLPGELFTAFVNVQNESQTNMAAVQLDFYRQIVFTCNDQSQQQGAFVVKDSLFRYKHESILKNASADFVVEWKLPQVLEPSTDSLLSEAAISQVHYLIKVTHLIEGAPLAVSPDFVFAIRITE